MVDEKREEKEWETKEAKEGEKQKEKESGQEEDLKPGTSRVWTLRRRSLAWTLEVLLDAGGLRRL